MFKIVIYSTGFFIFSFKALAPVLALHPAVQKLHTQTLSKNLQLNTQDLKSEEKGEKSKKPLAIILSWMLAKENHIDKYRSMYLTRGFDVLTVSVVPKDLLFPVSGSQVIASNVLDYILSNNEYDRVILHAFSVGAYMMGEMFVKLRDNDRYKSVVPRIQGVIVDSAVDFEGLPTGFPRSVSRNPLTLKVLEWYCVTHLALMYNVSTKHYLRSSKNFHNTPLRCPALFFTSETDEIGSQSMNLLARENWQVRGIDVRFKVFKDSKHVSHMYKYPEEYVAEVDNFLKKINLVPSKQ